MPVEMLQQIHAIQRLLIEFVALIVSLAAGAGLLVWLVCVLFLSGAATKDRRRGRSAS
jgi:hypothetical protein